MPERRAPGKLLWSTLCGRKRTCCEPWSLFLSFRIGFFFLAFGKVLEGLKSLVPQAIQVPPHGFHSLGIHVVDAARAVAGDHDKSGILQYLEVLRYGGPGYGKVAGQFDN